MTFSESPPSVGQVITGGGSAVGVGVPDRLVPAERGPLCCSSSSRLRVLGVGALGESTLDLVVKRRGIVSRRRVRLRATISDTGSHFSHVQQGGRSRCSWRCDWCLLG